MDLFTRWMIKEMLYLFILVVGFLFGNYIYSLCKEEVGAWKFRLKFISIISLILVIIMIFINFLYKTPIIITLGFIIVMNLTILSRNK